MLPNEPLGIPFGQTHHGEDNSIAIDPSHPAKGLVDGGSSHDSPGVALRRYRPPPTYRPGCLAPDPTAQPPPQRAPLL
jgi:hypothetical protein